jgi:hypothetical protein
MLEIGHTGVGHYDAVALEVALVLLQELDESFASDLLLTLDDERQVARKLGPGF